MPRSQYSVLMIVMAVCLAMAAGAWEEDEMKLIDVTATGANPNDGQDDTAGVRAALEKARDERADGIAFAPGRYDFHEPEGGPGHKVSIPIGDLDHFTIHGNGAELIFHGVTQPFSIAASDRFTIKDLTIDWEKPLISVGDVIESTDAYFDVQVFDEYPVVGGEKIDCVMDYDPETKLPRRHGIDVYWSIEKTELVAPQRLRVFTAFPFHPKVGFIAVLRHQAYGYNAFSFHQCKDVTVKDVTVYHTPGMAFTAGQCHNVTLERFKVLIKPGTRRFISANSDGSHFSGCTGVVRIKDCIFEGQGDDAINAKAGLYLSVTEKVDERTVLARHNLDMRDVRDPGDVMELTPPGTLIPYGAATVASCEWAPKDKTHRVVFEEALPERLAIGDLLGNATRCARFHISGTTFSRNRARGILMQTRGAIVEDCTFKDITSGGVWVLAEVTHFFECIPARDVVIRNNTFENCNYGGPLGDAVIGAFAYLKGSAPPPEPGVFRNITIENNLIRQADNCAIYLAGAENVTIKDNTVEEVCSMPTVPHGVNAIFVRSSRNVTLTGNNVVQEKQGEKCVASLGRDPGLAEDALTVEGNTGF